MVDEDDTFEGEEMESGEFAGDEDGEQDSPSRTVDAEPEDDGTSVTDPSAVLANAQVPEPTEAQVRDADARARAKAEQLRERGPRTPHARPEMPAQTSWADVVEASTKKDEVKPARKRYVDFAGERRELRPGEQVTKIAVDEPLTAAALIEKGDEKNRLEDEAEAILVELKDLAAIKRGQWREKTAKAKTLREELKTKKRTIYVESIEVREERTFRIETYRCDTGVLVDSRPMSGEERQPHLFAQHDLDGDADPTDITAAGSGVTEDAPKTSRRRGPKKDTGAKGGPKKASARATANGAAE